MESPDKEVKWVRLKDLSDRLKRIDAAGYEEVQAQLKAHGKEPYSFEYVRGVLENDAESESTWFVHEGDLVVPGSFAPTDGCLIVKGNLIVEGTYHDFIKEMTELIVYGDLVVDQICSECTLAVLGDVRAKGLVYLHYNDYAAEIAGSVHCKVLVVDDRSVSIDGVSEAETIWYTDYDPAPPVQKIFVNQVLDMDEDECGDASQDEDDEIEVDWELLAKMMGEGKRVLKI